MDLVTTDIDEVDAIPLPVFLSIISNGPEGVKIVAGVKGTSIGRRNPGDLTGPILIVVPAAHVRKGRDHQRRRAGKDEDHRGCRCG